MAPKWEKERRERVKNSIRRIINSNGGFDYHSIQFTIRELKRWASNRRIHNLDGDLLDLAAEQLEVLIMKYEDLKTIVKTNGKGWTNEEMIKINEKLKGI